MQIRQLRYEDGFQVATGNDRAQAATMVLAPGDAEGGPDNRHRGADQWLYVVAGEGAATVEGETHALRPGVILLIERGEAHEIRNTGAEPPADPQLLHAARVHAGRRYAAGGRRRLIHTSRFPWNN